MNSVDRGRRREESFLPVRVASNPRGVESSSGRDREWLERTRRLLRSGANLAAPGVGTAGAFVGGPAGLLGGFLLGAAAEQALLRVGAEFEQRHLGPREKARVAGTLYFALSEVKDRLEEGDTPRQDDFFKSEDIVRARADELLEAILSSARSDHEEQKAQHMGALYASFVFDASITRGDANYLIGIATQLTYHELVLLGLFHGGIGYRGMPGWDRLHPFEWRAQAVAGEIFELSKRGLLMRTDGKPIQGLDDVNPSELWVAPTGCKLFHLMRLDEIDEDRRVEVMRELEEVAALPIPHELIRQLESYVDSEPLSQGDIDSGRVRISLTERARKLLPEAGTELWTNVRGVQMEATTCDEGEGAFAELQFEGYHCDNFQAIFDSETGRILRIAPLPEGMLALD